jgi:hypothetical protein
VHGHLKAKPKKSPRISEKNQALATSKDFDGCLHLLSLIASAHRHQLRTLLSKPGR